MGEMPPCTCSHRYRDHAISYPESPPSISPCQVEPCECDGYHVDTEAISDWIMERHIDGGRS